MRRRFFENFLSQKIRFLESKMVPILYLFFVFFRNTDGARTSVAPVVDSTTRFLACWAAAALFIITANTITRLWISIFDILNTL